MAGLDEAGRGPLAGPVVAAAVIVRHFSDKNFKKVSIKDSKKLSPGQRELFYAALVRHPDVIWSTGIVSEAVIDRVNILQATKLAMRQALDGLAAAPDVILIDGNFRIAADIPQAPIVGGDAKVFSCAAAGIIAKVTRDRLMEELHEKYPQYGFDRHKGYGTSLHLKNLQRFGASPVHRKTFFPVKTLI